MNRVVPDIAEFVNIVEKNLRSFTVFCYFPESATVFITNYFECVMNDVILQDQIFQIYLIEFVGVYNSTHFGISPQLDLL